MVNDMNELNSNKRVAQAFVDSLRASDGEQFASLFTADAVVETIGSMAVSARKNVAHVAKEIGVLRKVFPHGMVLNLVTITAEENRVVCELQGLNTTVDGTPYNNRYMFLLIFEDGKISECREYQDTALVERVLMPTFKSLGVVANVGTDQSA